MMATGRLFTHSSSMGSPVRGFRGPVYSGSGVSVGVAVGLGEGSGAWVLAGRVGMSGGVGVTSAVLEPQAESRSSRDRQSGSIRRRRMAKASVRQDSVFIVPGERAGVKGMEERKAARTAMVRAAGDTENQSVV